MVYSVPPPIVTWSQVQTDWQWAWENISAKKITIPAVVCEVQLANMVPKLHAPEGQMSSHPSEGEDKLLELEQLDLGGLQNGLMKRSWLLGIFFVSPLIYSLKTTCT